MAKLKCVSDNRRVLMLKTGKVIHRSDGTACNTTIVRIGDTLYFRLEAMKHIPTSK